MWINRSRRWLAKAAKLLATTAALTILCELTWAEPPTSPANMLADAEIHSVFFLNAEQGWAVGDRGLILSTQDGGQHWMENTAPVRAALRCVYFCDAQHGWIVGGYVEPYSHSSRGVIFRTVDGGRQWTPIPSHTLPSLREIRMLDAQTGWAVGDASPLYPSGVFKTQDGGRSWGTIPSGVAGGLKSGDFASPTRGVVAGANGQLQLVSGSEVIPTRTPDLGGRPLNHVRLAGRRGGWLVGSGGLVLTTGDGGISWQRPLGSLPAAALTVDFHTTCSSGDHVWLAGSPGSFIYHSPDQGRQWRALPTGNTLPLRALHFVSPRLGWAVGSLGCIMQTRDGGESWSVQRQGGRRLAVLSISAAGDSVPLELLASECGGDGYLGRAIVLFPKSDQARVTASIDDRVHEAAVNAGASSGEACWRFPIANRGIATQASGASRMLDIATDGHGRKELLAYLVRQIRQWRPAIIVTDDPTQSPFAALANEQIAQAVLMAADPTRFNEQLTVQGLAAHQVQAVFQQTENGNMRLESSRLLPNIGASVRDYAVYSRGLLDSDFRSRPDEISLHGGSQVGVAGRGLFTNLKGLEPGRGARRKQGASLLTNLSQLQRMIQKSRNVREILNQSETSTDVQRQTLMVGQLSDLMRGVDGRAAGELRFRLAQSLWRKGRGDLAADTLQGLLTQHPTSPLADQAALWLVRYYASEEMQHLNHKDSQMIVSQSAARMTGPAKVQLANPFSNPQQKIKMASFDARFHSEQQAYREMGAGLSRSRAKQAIQFAQLIQRTRPNLYEDPRIRFPVTLAQRELGVGRAADGFFRRASDPDAADGWRESARAELWLTHLNGRPPKPFQPCFESITRPKLDGLLDDRIWQAAQPIQLIMRDTIVPETNEPTRDIRTDAALAGVRSSGQRENNQQDTPNSTRVWVAFDRDYLYLAAACGTDAPRADMKATKRQRDTDLSGRDRLEFFLDIDRDYGCFYRFQIDHRGWANDECFGAVSWNPKWHIAQHADDKAWYLEVAIPIQELTSSKSIQKQVWGFGVQRVQPNRRFQSWTTPADVDVRPEGFGLLSFETSR